MSPRRLETFTDGVIAVVITIMVLSLHPPTGSSLHDLRPLVPKLSVYLLSFVFVAIYWNNHHNLMHVVDRVTGGRPLGERPPPVLALTDARGGGVARAAPRRQRPRRDLWSRPARLGDRVRDPRSLPRRRQRA